MNDKKEIIKIWLIYSMLLMILLNFSIFFWDFYSGANTQGFGVLEPNYGMGMFYVYMISFFSSLIVVYAILRSKTFGIGFLLWTPYAIIGFFVEAYFELEVLISIWGVVGYCVFGLLTGLSADISYKLFKEKTSISEKIVAGLTGVIMSLTYFVTTIIAIGFFYKVGWGAGSFTDPGSFLGVAYFCLPWMIINAFFGGYCAYAIYYFSSRGKDNTT
ncbi:MAG: hypothetical protein KAW51_03215 [Candidatus Lokiarchaeota archaeon]|nr:hypothetical protein [Candidatus Lokiarchaeota archaeon]